MGGLKKRRPLYNPCIYNGSSSHPNDTSQEAHWINAAGNCDNLIFQKTGWTIHDFDHVWVVEQPEMLLTQQQKYIPCTGFLRRTGGFYTEHLSALLIL